MAKRKAKRTLKKATAKVAEETTPEVVIEDTNVVLSKEVDEAIEAGDLPAFEHLLKLKIVTQQDKEKLQELQAKYLNDSSPICFNCDPAVRRAYQKIIHFYHNNKPIV